MILLEMMILVAFAGAFLVYLAGKISSQLRNSLAVILSLVLVIFMSLVYRSIHLEVKYFSFLGHPLLFRIDWFSWFFGISIVVINFFAIIFSLSDMNGKERSDLFYFLMLVVNAGMLGVVFSADLISFYIYWEIMSISTFLLLSYKDQGFKAGMKYIVLSIIGSSAMLFGMLLIYVQLGTFQIYKIMDGIPLLSNSITFAILFLFSVAFGIKNALMPLHTWLPDSYTDSESPFTVVLSGMLTRMGIYGYLLILFVFVGLGRYLEMGSGSFSYILAWLGAITIILGTFIALFQNDAKKLLAWHGIGQGGYMILGIAFGTTLGVAGGIFHTLNHAIYIVLLYLSVGAVQYRTGTKDLNNLGGIIKRMPVAFVGGLLGISGLIGIPLTNGFVSKWLIYKTLILNGSPFLAFCALIGTWGTILSVYKFLHNMFLGQLPVKFSKIKRSPFSMQLPIIVFSIFVILFGILPGIPLDIINRMMQEMNFAPMSINIWGIITETGTLNTVNISFAIVLAIFGFYLLFGSRLHRKKVGQEDTYAAGTFAPPDKYSYTAEFYAPLFGMIKPIFREWVAIFFEKIEKGVDALCNGVRKIYVGDLGTYLLYIVFFLALLLFLRIGWSVW